MSFTADEVARLPAGLPGVYILAAFTGRSPYLEPFYVGQSKAIARRMAEHLNRRGSFARWVGGRLSTYFFVSPVWDAITRAAAEAALIRALDPAANNFKLAPATLSITLPQLQLIND